MPKLPQVSAPRLIKAFEKLGFEKTSQKGKTLSPTKYKKNTRK